VTRGGDGIRHSAAGISAAGACTFPRVEEIDRAIVGALTADGRMSYTDLAEKVGLSVSAAHQRVRRLEQRGVIIGYAARVSYEALDLPLTAFLAIRPLVRVASPVDLERLLQQIRTAANVTTRTTVVLSIPYENRPPRLTGPHSTAG
jgi:Lrp/AsnC family leucine-responsive transcriptional regulator